MKLSKIALSIIPFALLTQANATEHNLQVAGEVSLFSPPQIMMRPAIAQSSLVQNKKLSRAAINAPPQAITPVCPTLATGNQYTLSGASAGDVICYHFEITQRSKTTALLFGQTGTSNIDLSIIKHNADNTFTALGQSTNTGTDDEVVVTLTEPGHYYWYMEVAESDGSAFNVGASVTTQLDSYEFNDTVATATQLSAGQNLIQGNMDSLNDIDLYQFTAVNGQNLALRFLDSSSDEYIFEIYNGGWVPLSANAIHPISGLQPNQVITLRVRANTALPVNSANQYTLSVQSVVASFSSHRVSGEANVNRIPYSSHNDPYLTTQAYRNLNWALTINDSTGAPIENAKAKLVRLTTDGTEDYTATSNASGQISSSISLGTCSPNRHGLEHTEYSFGYRNTWRSDVEVGAWRIEIETNLDADNNGTMDTIGIGGDNVPWVFLGHICDQDLISSVKS
ncbi:hypothetical protein J8L98_07560 [Pseudoalteromonas sp. MMG013]|uniref:hypothetical protein n=1 Tax=Pseudoalteromonas sp. MMG013 TaxID=2822687 RepID=UPI001B36F5E2|nr:hypothetical protein [Pseudoalteromonas sp. MMG013]MBQ4861544.1 hypothetical protein [Pseudoalteromonas sp. MMG013]